jgi:RND family efflux transporter MFP subunit
MKSALLCLSAAALLASGCGRGPYDHEALSNAAPAKVRLATVRAVEIVLPAESVGTVRPQRTAQVAAKVMGAIEQMPVALGQRVRAGDLVARIGADEISARVAQARAQLNAARRDLERERDLLEKSASTAETVRGLEDRFAGAEAMVREAEDMMGYTELRAPFNGIISRKFADVGDLASPGSPLLEIEAAGQFQVEAPLPDSLADRLQPGELLTVGIPTLGVTFRGKLVELSSSADPGAHTVMAKIAVPAEVPVRSGEFARVQVNGAPVTALMAPASCVAALGQMQRVFVAGGDNRAGLRLVKTGAVRGDLVEILSGLDANERVVVSPPAGLREGQLLEIQP